MKLDLALTDVIFIRLALEAAAQREAEAGRTDYEEAILRVSAEVNRQQFAKTGESFNHVAGCLQCQEKHG